MKIKQETIDALMTPEVLVEIAKYCIPDLKKQGSMYVGYSPFRQEKTPSFIISPSKMIWKDFGGDKSGKSPISLYREIEGVDFETAVKQCCKITNIPFLIEEGKQTTKQLNYKEALHSLSLFFEKELTKNPIAIEYIRNRGINIIDSVKKFRIGYAPKWDTMIEYFNNSNYQEEYLKLKLFTKDYSTNKIYPKFYNRITFPIFNNYNQIVGFSARDITGKSKAKYINSNESEIFHKGNVLYGLNFVDKLKKKIILVEGQIDVILAHQYGIDIAVASQGTAFTYQQLRLIKDNDILIAYDGDQAGQKATYKVVEMMLKEGKIPKVSLLPTNEDIAEILSKSGGKKRLYKIFKSYIDGIKYYVENVKDDNPEIMFKKMKEFENKLSSFPLPIEEALKKEYFKITKGKFQNKKPQPRKTIKNNELSLEEKSVIKYALIEEEVDIIKIIEKCLNIKIDDNFLIKVVDGIDYSEHEFLEALNNLHNTCLLKRIEKIKRDDNLKIQQKMEMINALRNRMDYYLF